MKTFSVRLADDVSLELDHLAQLMDMSKNELIQLLIRQEYSKIGADPQVKKAFSQMQQLKSLLEKFAEENSSKA